MGFVIGLLNFIGFIFYIIAGIAAFATLLGFMSNDNKDGGGIKVGLMAAVAGLVFGCGGYFIRDYADSLKRSKNFTESFSNGDKFYRMLIIPFFFKLLDWNTNDNWRFLHKLI